MFENIMKLFKKSEKKEALTASSKDAAKERLHLVLMQDRANVSADFLDLMRQEIIEVIKKYIDIDENTMDVRLTNQTNDDGTQGAPALYANIPILNIKDETRAMKKEEHNLENQKNEDVKNNSTEMLKDENEEKDTKTETVQAYETKTREDNNKSEDELKERKSNLEEKKTIEDEKMLEEKTIEQAKKIVKEENT